MSEELTIVFKEIDTGNNYWNDRIREIQEDHKPLILWMTKKIIEDLEQ